MSLFIFLLRWERKIKVRLFSSPFSSRKHIPNTSKNTIPEWVRSAHKGRYAWCISLPPSPEVSAVFPAFASAL